MKGKISLLGVTSFSLLSNTIAHTDGDTAHHMMEGSLWGWHWTGGLFMLAFWVLVILAIIFLVQKIMENAGGDSE